MAIQLLHQPPSSKISRFPASSARFNSFAYSAIIHKFFFPLKISNKNNVCFPNLVALVLRQSSFPADFAFFSHKITSIVVHQIGCYSDVPSLMASVRFNSHLSLKMLSFFTCVFLIYDQIFNKVLLQQNSGAIFIAKLANSHYMCF